MAQQASDFQIQEVTVTQRKKATLKSRTDAFDTQRINSEELCRAACCNLSEAFETNASVDVAYADAATGAKQIRLLGLSGTYVQLIQENTPAVRGLAQNYGLEYIPGPWMQSIQVSKGTSSVINGYEATTGQINAELLKPNTQNPLSINLMFNSELMAEANIMGGWQVLRDTANNKSLYTGILAHYTGSFMAMDENHDTFADMPKVQNANLANRWFYKHNDYTFQAFVRGLYDRRRAGQNTNHQLQNPNPYLIDLNTWRVEGFVKNGYIFDPASGSSIALVTALSYHNLDNTYGNRHWKAAQFNGYLNALCQLNFEGRGTVDNDHRLTTGLSLNVDKYWETLTGVPFPVTGNPSPENLDRAEYTPGLFAEYNFKYADQLSLIAGLRVDWSTRYGPFLTPRMNIRYTPFEWWILRASVGLGHRTPNLIADNAGLLVSSREWKRWNWSRDGAATFETDPIRQERALNTGLSMTFNIPVPRNLSPVTLSLEYYYTRFYDGLILDLDRDPHAIYIYDIRSFSPPERLQSFAHCAQIELSFEPLRGWTWTAAFRWTDAEQTTFNSATGRYELRPKALASRFKGILSTSYQTPLKKWQFDVTAQFNGVGRMPDGFSAPTWYPQLMAQITKYFRTCSLYLGAENMTNYRQTNPIIGWEDPFGPDFDASMVYAPTSGWKIYLGFRYDLEKKE